MKWMKLEPIIQSEVSKKHQYTNNTKNTNILTHIYGIEKDSNSDPICKTAKETHVKNRLLDNVGEGKGGTI